MHISKLHQGMWAVPLGLDCRPMGGGATAWQGLHLLENLIVRRLPSGPSQYNLLLLTHRGPLFTECMCLELTSGDGAYNDDLKL